MVELKRYCRAHAPTEEQSVIDESGEVWACATCGVKNFAKKTVVNGIEGGSTAHADLTGLDADDHPQYPTEAEAASIAGGLITTHTQAPSAHHTAFIGTDCDAKITTHTNNASAHHTPYTDTSAKAACVSDTVYGAGWASVTDVAPSKKSVYNKIETIQGGSAPDPILGAITETDDFIVASTETGEVGALSWSFTNGSMVSANAEQYHPGIITRRSGTTAAQIASFYPGGAGTTTRFRYDEWTECTYIIACVTTGTDFAVRVGIISDATSNTPANGAYFEKLAADTAWFRVTRAASTETRNTTSVNISTSWVKFTVKKNGANIEFYINGTLNGTHTTNIMAAATGILPFVQVIPSTTTARDLKMDLIQYRLVAMTR